MSDEKPDALQLAANAWRRCEAETRVKRGAAWIQHTLRCQKDAGHETKPGDEAHTFKDGARTTVWFGVPQRVQDNTRFRFGRSL